jgi:type II secretory pathway component PulK
MKALHYLPLRRSEAGVALLISIFVLMLISVMALSLILASGTETSLAGNYRSSASAYYAALAGLEEARGRLLPKNPSYLGAAVLSPFRQM